jgi:hypothetical protein
MLKFISLAFSWTRKPRHPNLSIEPEVEDAIVASHSHGNVRVQAGMFDTKDEVDAEYGRIRGTKFAV